MGEKFAAAGASVDKSLGEMSTKADAMGAKMDATTAAADKSASAIGRHADSVATMANTSGRALAENEAKAAAWADHVNNASDKVASGLHKTASKFESFGIPFGTSMHRMADNIHQASLSGKGFSQTLTEMGKATATVGVAGFAAAGAEALHMAADYQSALTTLVTGAGESEKNIKMVGAGIQAMGPQVGMTAGELVKGMYMIESAGYHGAEGLKVLKASAEGAKVGNADMATVANAVTTALTDYHLPASQASAVTSALVETVASGKTHMEDLAGSIGRVMPQAAAMGVSFQQVTGAIATMTNHGMSARLASMSLGNTLMALGGKPSTTALKAMAAVGLSSQQLRDELAHGGLTGALNMVSTAVGEHFPKSSVAYTSAMATILGGTVGYRTALMLTGPSMKQFQADTKAIGDRLNSSGQQVQGFSQVQKELNFQFDSAKASIEDAALSFGNFLIPKVREASQALATAFDWLRQHKAIAEALAGVIGGVLAVAVMAFTVNTISRFISGVSQAVQSLSTWIGKITGLGSAQQTADATMQESADTTNAEVSGQFDAMQTSVQTAMQEMATAVQTAAEEIQAAAAQISTALATQGEGAAASSAQVETEMSAEATSVQAAASEIEGSLTGVDTAFATTAASASESAATVDGAMAAMDAGGAANGLAAVGESGAAAAAGMDATAASATAMSGELTTATEAAAAGEMGAVGLGSAVMGVAAIIPIAVIGLSMLKSHLDAGVKAQQAAGKSWAQDFISQIQNSSNPIGAAQAEIKSLTGQITSMAEGTHKSGQSAEFLQGEIGQLNTFIKQEQMAAHAAADAHKVLASQQTQGAAATANYVQQLQNDINAQKMHAQYVQVNSQLSGAYDQTVQNLTATIHANGAVIDKNTTQGQNNRAALEQVREATVNQVSALEQEHASVQTVNGVLAAHVEQLIGVFQQAGMTTGQIAQLLAQYHLIPPSVSTAIGQTGGDAAIRTVETLQAALAALPSVKNIVITATNATQGLIKGFAAGAVITQPTLAMLGEQSQPEVVLPLSDPNRMVQLLQEAAGVSPNVAKALGQMGNTDIMAGTTPAASTSEGVTTNVNVYAQTNADPTVIAQEIAWVLKTM